MVTNVFLFILPFPFSVSLHQTFSQIHYFPNLLIYLQNDNFILSLPPYCGLGCPKIKDLDLSYCNNITSACLGRVLKQWYCLEQLNLRGFQADLSLIQHDNLEQLNLSWCKMVDDCAVGIIAEGCPNLVGLDLAWNSKITGNSVHKLASKCKSLRSLNLRGCTRVSMLTIQYLSGASSMVICC
jgi:hypothetical protein